MMRKIEISFFYIVFPVLFFPGLILFLCSCTKKDAAVLTPLTPVYTSNADSMPNSGPKKYLALGDSYTIGTSVIENDRYPVQTAAILKTQGINITTVDIIATNGWTTGNLINGINSSQLADSYDAVSLLIGVNNQYQGGSLEDYKQQFTTLIRRSVQLANGKPDHVFVLSIPDYSVTPFARGRNTKEIAAEIDAFNNANKTIAENYKVNYLYITEESRKAANDPSLIASDSLHFSGKEYSIWSYKLAPMIKAVLK
ncbi:MAG: SGNH/GDSL hydrolase family protein [Chitinophagaceae bacterium]